ncbi:MAG: hypothetical protein ACLRPT_00520 [Akkermansia muciniphila]
MALIVGFGPAGMFAALRCLELGMKPVVLERGRMFPPAGLTWLPSCAAAR